MTWAARLRGALEKAAAPAILAWARRSRPRPRSLRVEGLGRGTTVRFDEHGVPHVRAATEADAFRALGACHALDRFLPMDLGRRLLRGRLCELVGERPLGERALPPLSKGTTLDVDKLMRVMSLERAAQRTLDAASADDRDLVEAYAEGVNAGVAALRRRKPLEYRLLGIPIEDWRPIDTALVGKGMAMGLSFKWRVAPVAAAVAAALRDRPDRLETLLPPVPTSGVATARVEVERRGLETALAFLGWDSAPVGSNAWLVGGDASASGKPLLAGDPHLELSLPPIWYLASVSGGGYAAVGGTMPGLPVVFAGRTPTVAWTVTNGMIDDGDVWAETLDGTGTRYECDGRWRDLEVETHEIRRRGGAPTVFRVRRTHRGPLLSDALPGAEGAHLSLRLTLHETTHDLQGFAALGRARTAADVDAIAGFGSPCQNLLWATVDGEAGYRLLGRVPLRGPGPVLLPRDGRTSSSDWLGDVPACDLPAFRCAPGGFVVSANDPQAAEGYPYYLSCLYEPPWRAARIRQRLAGRRGLRSEDMAAIQTDAGSLAAEHFRRAIVLPHVAAVREARPALGAALDRLLASPIEEEADAVGPALVHLVYHHLARRVFAPALGDALAERWFGCINLIDGALRRAMTEPDSPWAAPSVRPTLLGQAIDDALKDLAARGLSMDARWGALHALTLRHPFSPVPVLGRLFSRGPFAMRGSPYTPCAGQYLHSKPCEVYAGVSYRQVVDLADPESARMVTFGGQQGWLGAPHYDDLTPLWLAGRYVPMRLSTWPSQGRDLRLVPA
jgi:penicillin amidase